MDIKRTDSLEEESLDEESEVKAAIKVPGINQPTLTCPIKYMAIIMKQINGPQTRNVYRTIIYIIVTCRGLHYQSRIPEPSISGRHTHTPRKPILIYQEHLRKLFFPCSIRADESYT